MRNRSKATLAIAVTAAVLLSAAARAEAPPGHYPWAKRVAAAKRWAEQRQGRISFAVVDESGRMHGFHPDRVHNSASVVKVLFMVALLREPDVRDDALGDSERRAARADDPPLRQRGGDRDLQPGRRAARCTSSPTRRGSSHFIDPAALGADDDHRRLAGAVHRTAPRA